MSDNPGQAAQDQTQTTPQDPGSDGAGGTASPPSGDGAAAGQSAAPDADGQQGPPPAGDQGDQPTSFPGADPAVVAFLQQFMQSTQGQQQAPGTQQDGQQAASDGGSADDGSSAADASGDKPTDSQSPDPSMQVPQTWDKYEAPEGVVVPDAVKRMAHQEGLTQRQFNATLQTMMTYTQASKLAEVEQLRQQGEKLLKEEWKDQAEYKLNMARRAVRTVDKNGELQRLLDTTGYGNHPVILKFFARLGEHMREGGFLKGEVNKPAGMGNPSEQG